jgi:hypothetical protein
MKGRRVGAPSHKYSANGTPILDEATLAMWWAAAAEADARFQAAVRQAVELGHEHCANSTEHRTRHAMPDLWLSARGDL